MPVKIEKVVTQTLKISEKELKEILAEWAKKEHGFEVTSSHVSINVSADGDYDDGGYSGGRISGYHSCKAHFDGVTITRTDRS